MGSINDIKYHEKHCVILLGNTGVGKSTIACYLSNTTESDTFKVSHTSVVTTNDVHHKEVKVFRGTESESLFNTTLQILDCPGLGNTAKDKDGNKLTDDHVLKLISNSIRINCREGVSSFLLVLDGKEDVAHDTIAKYIKKFTPKVLIKNLIVLINRAEEYDHTIEQFFQVFKDYLEQEYADESMRAYIRGQVTTIPQVHIATIDEE